MTEPVLPLISLLGEPGAACQGDDCGVVDAPRPDSEEHATVED